MSDDKQSIGSEGFGGRSMFWSHAPAFQMSYKPKRAFRSGNLTAEEAARNRRILRQLKKQKKVKGKI